MFLIDSVDESKSLLLLVTWQHRGLKYLVTNTRVITALLEMYKFHLFFFLSPLSLSYTGIKWCVLMDKEPSVQFPVSRRNSWLDPG